MLFAATGMVTSRISANLLSLGAIDFGIIVDGAVVMVENIIRRIAQRQREVGDRLEAPERLRLAYSGAAEVARPTLFGVSIIMAVYLPILTLAGIEGKMFRPMAEVVLYVLAGALVLAFTFVPALVALLLRGRVAEAESPVVRGVRRLYLPTLRWSLRHRIVVVVTAVLLLVASGFAAARLGSEFVPTLDEGDITIQPLRIPGTSLDQAIAMQHDVDATIARFPEVADVYSRLGTDEFANDPMPPNLGDIFVILKPRRDWPNPRKPKATLIRELEERLNLLPGQAYEFTQPIQMRFNELIAGVRSDVAVKVFGDDLEVMRETAEHIATVLRSIPGTSDVRVEQVTGLPTLTVDIDRATAARYGLNIEDVQSVVQTALAGTEAGELLEGDRRFPIVVRLPEGQRSDIRALAELPIAVPSQGRPLMDQGATATADPPMRFVPLGTVAHIRLEEGPNQISREQGKRRVVVQCNVRGRDLGSVVSDAQRAIRSRVQIPPGYWTAWGGEFENILSARARLMVAVPIALSVVLILLFGALGSLKDTVLVFSGVPLALTGGIAALALRGMPFSITAGVGLIALSGVAVLNGLVMLSFVRARREQGDSVEAALLEGCATRLRPVLMTGLVASLGFIPMALATGPGAEVQRPLATVVVGGIISSTLLTLVVLPALYRMFHREEPRPS